MSERKIGPLRASLWLTDEEKRYILVVCAILLFGMAARYWHLKREKAEPYAPRGVEKTKEAHG